MSKNEKPKRVTKSNLPIKICEHCQKPMEWRKKWARSWDEVKFCSERCRRENKSVKNPAI